MRLLLRYTDLSPQERRLFFSTFTLLILIRAGLWLLPYRVVRAALEYAGRFPTRVTGLDRKGISRVVWAVGAASRRIPGTTCLPQAMAIHFLLGRRGEASALRLGVAFNPEGRLEAHAWVEIQGRVISGGAVAGFDRFVPLRERLT